MTRTNGSNKNLIFSKIVEKCVARLSAFPAINERLMFLICDANSNFVIHIIYKVFKVFFLKASSK